MLNDKYIQIIVSYFRYLTKCKCECDNDIKVNKLCNLLDDNPEKLKKYLLEIESIIFHSNKYVNESQCFIWKVLKLKWLPVYNKIDESDYERLYHFFLLMTHNIPVIPCHSDNSVPGCHLINKNSNACNNTGIKRKYNESSYELFDALRKLKKYKKDIFSNKFTDSNIYNRIIPISEYMRVEQWINKDAKYNKYFECICENHF